MIDPIEEMIEAVLDWAEENRDFDTKFILSLEDQYNETGSISEKQQEALENIIEKFGIEV